ncbi:hypothetical protein FGU71_11100 [Erythrobacter insulae]|uniref:Uncharacterized protein n=1 Tax=Erythrobacter insulae TaxID=2584124 RepID=A0A547PDZ4_9SPHN|nr:hypothetical protein [Erythrobacter insulae]TRD12355.1 hypothetical protein FGU71_11100 [Erythrobacter insulae]
MKKFVLTLATGSLALGGCQTHLSVKHDVGLADAPLKTKGIPYRLPETDLNVGAQWTLERCPKVILKQETEVDEGTYYDEKNQELRWLAGQFIVSNDNIGIKLPETPTLPLEVALAASYTTNAIEGPSYILDYEDLAKAFKTTDITFEYHAGTALVKSINATVEGQEPAAFTSGLKIAGSIARLALGIPSVAAAGDGAKIDKAGGPKFHKVETVFEPCTPLATELVTQRNTLVSQAKSIGAEATSTTNELAILEGQLAIPEGEAAGRRPTKAEKKKLDKLSASSKSYSSALKKITAALTVLDKKLTVKGRFNLHDDALSKDGKALSAKIKPDMDQFSAFKKEMLKPNAVNAAEIESLFAADLKFVSSAGADLCHKDAAASQCKSAIAEPAKRTNGKPKKDEAGFVFRPPAQLRMTLRGEKEPKPTIDENVRIAQFGRFRVLPLTNGFGENNSIIASFAIDGTPTKIQYKKPKSSGAEILKSGELALQDILALRDASKTADDAKKTDLELENERLTTELDNLTKLRDIRKVQDELSGFSAETPSEIELINEKITVLTLEAQIAELERRIRDAASVNETEGEDGA